MKRSVLIIDDDPIFTAFLCTLLKEEFEVTVANEGYSAITFAMNTAPDIILLDIVMPGMSGHEVASSLSYLPETQDTPIIFITGEPIDESLGMPGNVRTTIQKGLTKEDIMKKIRENTPIKGGSHNG